MLPGVRYAVDAYVNFARRKPWIEAVASSLTELFGPERDPRPARGARGALSVDRSAPASSTSATGWCRRRATRDYALGLVVERCVTREQQERAVAALRFKTEVLWAQLDAIERGDTQPEVAA